MTTVRVGVKRPAATGNATSEGSLEFTPTRARTITEGAVTTLILPTPFTVKLAEGAYTLELDPTALDWAWTVRETFPGLPSVTRTLAVPDLAEQLDYTALADVDPETLTPVEDAPAPAWYAYVDGLEVQALASATASEGSRVAAVAAQAAATGSQTSAAASAATATTKAGEAATSATAASASATTASGHVTTAAGHSGNALAYSQQASTSADGAATSATGAAASAVAASNSATTASDQRALAESARTGAETARTGSETAKDASVAAANGFSIGTVTTGNPGAPATANITGTAPGRYLDLTLPKGDTGPANSLSVIETVTGPETAGATGPQGLTGATGAPGGWVYGADLVTNDLNNITTPGQYRQNNAANATLVSNYPLASSTGFLDVWSFDSGATGIIQRFQPFGNVGESVSGYYQRRKNGAAWGTWVHYSKARVDQAAGRAVYIWDDLNSREQRVYGDTGWRDISTSLANGFLGALAVRREHGAVTLRGTVRCPPGTASMNGTFVTLLPTGFYQNTNAPWVFFPARSNVGSTWFTLYRKGGELVFEGSPTVADGNETRFEVTFSCAEAWPTTLPGTAIGTIPNT